MLDWSTKFDPDEPRDEHGRWTDGGGGSDGGGAGKPTGAKHPGAGYSKNAWVDSKGVIHTSNVYDAQRALFEDRKVELKQVKQVSTLIRRLGETAAEMAEHGEKAPVFNLCNVSVEGTNLFCAEQKGIPRAEMPVIPAKRTKEFIKHLKKLGYKVEKDNERAAHLRATQSEIDGAKVAVQMGRIREQGFYKRLVISRDDYILDGHHTWAGQLGIDAQDNNLKDEKSVKVARVDIGIIDLVKEADKWTKEQGIAKKPAGQASYAYISLRQAAEVLDAETYAKYAGVAYRFFAANGHLAQGFDDVMIALPVGHRFETVPGAQPCFASTDSARPRNASQCLASSAQQAKAEREETEVELWPETGETEDDFMDRCVSELTVCIGDRAESVCADKWESSKELGKKGFVTLSMLSGDLALEPCGTSCLGCRGAPPPAEIFEQPMREIAELLKFDPDEPRDEYGRWTTGGGGGDHPGAAPVVGPKIDAKRIEAKTKFNVERAAKEALDRGVEPLEGSAATHPNTIASRLPTAKGSKKEPALPVAYRQPNLAAMKTDPESYEHNIALFSNPAFYPNFRKGELSGSTDARAATIIGQMKENLKFLYGLADKSTTVWYDGARALVDDRAKLWGFNDASIAGVYAALSPTKDWDQNVHLGDMLMRVYKTQQDHGWDGEMDAKANAIWSKKNQKIVDLVRGKKLSELQTAAEKAVWIRTYEETHGNTDYRVVQPNGALGPIAQSKPDRQGRTTAKKVVWQSLASITNAVKALEANGDRETISAAMGSAHKVRSFYNNILDPHSGNGDVTIDTHAVGAALLQILGGSSVPVMQNFGLAPEKKDKPEGWESTANSSKTGLSGTYGVYEQAYQEAAKELGIQARQLQSAVWVVKRSLMPKTSKADIDGVWQEYQTNPKMTLAEAHNKIAAVMRPGGDEDEDEDERRYFELDEESGRRDHARELHRPELGRDAAGGGLDSRAGARAAEGAAGLDAFRDEGWRTGAEEVARDWDEGKHPRAPAGTPEGGQFTSDGGGGGGGGGGFEHGMIEVSARAFVESRDVSTRQQFLSAHPAEELGQHTLLMNRDGTVGISVDPHGDVQNVFNNGGPKGGAAKAMVAAIEHGGRTLDCYDGFLPSYYGQFGFKEVQRMKFNPEFAPKGWDFAKYDNPDIVFMGWNGYDAGGAKGAVERASSRKDWIKVERTNSYGDDWDAAKAASRAAAVGGGEEVRPGVGEAPRAPAEPAGGGAGAGASESTGGNQPLLISERPNQEKIDAWRKQLTDRQEELNQQGKTGEYEDDQLQGMQVALNAYSQEDQENLDKERSGLNVRYDLDNKLMAAAFTDVRGDVAKIAYFGALDENAHRTVINDLVERWGGKVKSIEVNSWKDNPSLPLWEEAGFKPKEGEPSDTIVTLEKRIGSTAAAPDFEHVPVPVSVSEGVGTDFQTEIRSALDSIPPRAMKTMAEEGISFRIGQRMTELNPELKAVHPRGWPAGMTWDTAEGMFSHAQKAVNVTEFYRPVGQKEFVRTTRTRGAVLHESGHALDYALDRPSATSKAFIEAYEDDRRAIPKEARGALRYYLQKGKAGRSEAFAEIFGWHIERGAGRQDIRKYFPRTSELVKKAMVTGIWLEPIA